MKTLLIHGILWAFLSVSTLVSYSQGQSEIDQTASNKKDNNYNVKLYGEEETLVYYSGYFKWNKAEKKNEYVEGRWIAPKQGYHWEATEWAKPKHGWKYTKKKIKFKHQKLSPKSKGKLAGEKAISLAD